MLNKCVFAVLIESALFSGCASISEQLEEAGHLGVKELDLFIGVPFGARFPDECDVVSYTTNKWDRTAWDFVNNRKIIDAVQVRNTVKLHEGKVYEVDVWLQNYTDQSYKSAKEIDYQSRPSYSFSGTTRKGFGNQVEIDGYARPSMSGVTTMIMGRSRRWTNEMFPELVKILEQRYGKAAVRYSDNCYVIPFENGRAITVKNHYIGLGIEAKDEKMEKEKKLKKEQGFIRGVDAL